MFKPHYSKPGSSQVKAIGKTPTLGGAIGKVPQRMSGGRLWHPQPGVMTNMNGRLLHADTVAERAKRGLPPYREPVIGEPDPTQNPDAGGGE